MKHAPLNVALGLALSLGIVSTPLSFAQTVSDFLGPVQDLIQDTIDAATPASDPLDDNTTDWGDGTSDSDAGSILDKVTDAIAPPSDPLDDNTTDWGDGTKDHNGNSESLKDKAKDTLGKSTDPLDAPPEGYDGDDKNNPINKPTDPLNDPADLGDADPTPSPEYEKLHQAMLDMVNTDLEKIDAEIRAEMERLRADHIEELKLIQEEYNAVAREGRQGRRDVCRSFTMNKAKRAMQYKTRQANETYYWNMLHVMNQHKTTKVAQGYAGMIGPAPNKAKLKAGFVEMLNLQREDDRLTLEQYYMMKRHIEERKNWHSADAKDELECSKAQCREMKSPCPNLNRDYQEVLRNIQSSYRSEIAIIDEQIRQAQAFMADNERNRQQSLRDFGKEDTMESLSPEEKQMVQKMMNKQQQNNTKNQPPVIRGNGKKGTSFKPAGTHFTSGSR